MMDWEAATKEYNQAAAEMIEKIQRCGDLELADKVHRFTSATLRLIEMKQRNDP